MKVMTQTEQVYTETATVCGQSKDIGVYALALAVNTLAAAGASHLRADVHIMIPPFAYKSRIHTMEKIMKTICSEKQIEIDHMKSGRNAALTQSMVIVTVSGTGPKEEKDSQMVMHAGQDIVLTKWVGMEGMLRIASEKEAQLKERFAPVFLKQVRDFREEIFASREIDVAKARGVSVIRQVTEGGILAALWNLAKEAGTGLTADMKQLSIRQETIELCEYFRLNPYQMTSAGSMLMVTDNGEVLADALHGIQVQAAVIGRLTDSNDKILQNGEEIRYIDRPAPDELMKLFDGGAYDRD